jgi:hypothetical protein
MQNNEIIAVIDRVEDDEWASGGKTKKYKVIITKSGEDFKIGERLEAKWGLLQPGVAVRLIMDTFQKGNEVTTYVKDFDRCYDLTMDKMAELSQPAPKNPKDASIERQVAVKCVCDLLASEHGSVLPQDIVDATIEWLRSALK